MKAQLLTHEVGRLLGLTPDSVRRLERRGRLHAVRVGGVRLFSREEVEAERHRRAGSPPNRSRPHAAGDDR